ncbi:hypothetical protein [Granulosicoccus antarcticus]|uniref:hypothetical protein n=1 Tax=Granulosicoccus antarcticus TaxID=437505 RepID=UPI000B5A63F2|nr:hypothetical protein [Granulosicoccus antarcticus]
MPDRLSPGIFATVLLMVNAGSGRVGAGWVWDFANGLGFSAMAGLIYLFMQHSAGIATRYHRACSYVVLLLIVAHALFFLLIDPLLLEYLKPGAPAYMWFGVIGFLLIILLIVTADRLPIKRSFVSGAAFRRWHRRLSWLALLAIIGHVTISGLYIRGPVQFALLALLVVAAVLPALILRWVPARGFSSAVFFVLAVFLALGLAASLNVRLP